MRTANVAACEPPRTCGETGVADSEHCVSGSRTLDIASRYPSLMSPDRPDFVSLHHSIAGKFCLRPVLCTYFGAYLRCVLCLDVEPSVVLRVAIVCGCLAEAIPRTVPDLVYS